MLTNHNMNCSVICRLTSGLGDIFCIFICFFNHIYTDQDMSDARFFCMALFFCGLLSVTAAAAFSQDVSFSYSPGTGKFASDQFRTDLHDDSDDPGSMRLREGELVFGDGASMVSGFNQMALSDDRSYAGFLFKQGENVTVEVYRTDGTLLHRLPRLVDYDPDDPSVKLYMLNNGSFIYRDNIAGFTFFDERGKEIFDAYNSTGSPDGESISELAPTPFGKKSVMINPKIYQGDNVNSRVRLTGRDGDASELAHFNEMSIETVDWHQSTRLMVVHGRDENDGSHYGNVLSYRGDLLFEVNYDDDEIEELVLSNCGRYLTARTTGRAIVHRISDGERLGSASFRQRIQAASYMPDGMLAVITGSDDNGHLKNLRAHIIDLEERIVVREETSLETHSSPQLSVRMEYLEPSVYRLAGTSREIIIRHSL